MKIRSQLHTSDQHAAPNDLTGSPSAKQQSTGGQQLRQDASGFPPRHSGKTGPEGNRSRPVSAGAVRDHQDAVIFLDIDGVLHSLYGNDIFKESCCDLLEKIIRGTRASVVLSSTWRLQERSVAMVNALLKRRQLASIIDRTKDLSTIFNMHVPREAEVCEWLDRHPKVSRWIAIDDMDLQSDHTEHARRMRGHFVQTNPYTGLVPHNAELAIRLMQQQKPTRMLEDQPVDRQSRHLKSRGRTAADSPRGGDRRPQTADVTAVRLTATRHHDAVVGRATVNRDFAPRARSADKASAQQRISRGHRQFRDR